MTGLVFATFSKFIEIGYIVNKKAPELTRAQKREELERLGLPNNKRNRKSLEKETQQVENIMNMRNIKHFSAVQNKPIYMPDIENYKNKVMMNIDIPAFWNLD